MKLFKVAARALLECVPADGFTLDPSEMTDADTNTAERAGNRTQDQTSSHFLLLPVSIFMLVGHVVDGLSLTHLSLLCSSLCPFVETCE